MYRKLIQQSIDDPYPSTRYNNIPYGWTPTLDEVVAQAKRFEGDPEYLMGAVLLRAYPECMRDQVNLVRDNFKEFYGRFKKSPNGSTADRMMDQYSEAHHNVHNLARFKRGGIDFATTLEKLELAKRQLNRHM